MIDDRYPELRNAADFLPEILELMNRTPLVTRVASGFDVLDEQDGNIYEIDNSPLLSVSDVMFWVRQLGEKTWVTKEHLVDFAQAIMDATGKKNHG